MLDSELSIFDFYSSARTGKALDCKKCHDRVTLGKTWTSRVPVLALVLVCMLSQKFGVEPQKKTHSTEAYGVS